MSKHLVIVESPSKSKTIGKYLGDEFKVVSSKGHIRDLATTGKFGLGVDIEDGFKPNYIPITRQKKLITSLKKDVKESDIVYLASDPDREGEAIAWHLKDALGIKDDKYKRVLFHEITHDKVIDAIKNPTVIDDNLVRSQETRRILDRIIGFRLSKLLQNKIGAKSAGRVQSVALKLIVDREREIDVFNPEEYWTITSHFSDFDSDLFQYKNEDIKLENKEEVDKVLSELTDSYNVSSVSTKPKKKNSKFPFITSTLQQEASTKLGFPAKKTMSIAQKLYEGIDLGSETAGLITYMRTDSTRLSDEFINPTLAYIKSNFGDKYIGYVKNSKKSDNVQDAHEAIRPTSINRDPLTIKQYLRESKTNFVYSVRGDDGKLAITNYKVVKENDNYSLLDINIETGRKNQIRVALNSIGTPILGDKKYNDKKDKFDRLYLHANKLKIYYPVIKKDILFETQVPSEFKKIMRG